MIRTLAEVRELTAKGNVIPLHRRIGADLDTPVSAYIKLVGRKRDSFLLESIEGGEKLARYSFLGFDPFLIIEGESDRVKIRQGRRQKTIRTDPIDFMRELFSIYKPVRDELLPRFTGGAVGYFSYDCIKLIEKIPDENPDIIGLPMMRFGLFKEIVVFDHLKQEIIVIVNILHDKDEPGLAGKYKEAVATLDKTIDRLSVVKRLRTKPRKEPSAPIAHYEKDEFEKMVRHAKLFIKEGDIFQVVLSQRWQIDSGEPALAVYRRLRRLNPSPYMFLLNFGNDAIIGASPEMLARVEKGQIETRPIAGTRPRGKNEKEDDNLSRDLLADPKELAEHTMLLDLGRNDVGRVSKPGSVEVRQKMAIEKYSHVIHMVSSVVGKLKRNTSALEGHFACFPAGTVSGAPKIRAMEIIDSLEKYRRSVYAGSIAYLDFWGNLDSCIAIRTIVKKGPSYFIQAGAGIVADSKPAREFRETQAKAQVLLDAVMGDTDQ